MNVLEFISSALGLLVVAVPASFAILLVTTRVQRVIFGIRRGEVRGFLSNFD